jgi:hypothetical protein
MSYLFANDEVFYEFKEKEWYRNSFGTGANLGLYARQDLQVRLPRLAVQLGQAALDQVVDLGLAQHGFCSSS